MCIYSTILSLFFPLISFRPETTANTHTHTRSYSLAHEYTAQFYKIYAPIQKHFHSNCITNNKNSNSKGFFGESENFTPTKAKKLFACMCFFFPSSRYLFGSSKGQIWCKFGLTECQIHMWVMENNKNSPEGTIYQPLRSGRIWHKVNF